MNIDNNTDHQHYWQAIKVRVSELAARHSGLGIKPDSVEYMPANELIGNYNFLTNYHINNGG